MDWWMRALVLRPTATLVFTLGVSAGLAAAVNPAQLSGLLEHIALDQLSNLHARSAASGSEFH